VSTPDALPRAWFTGLVDHAGVYPPASLDLADALADYRVLARSDRADLLGPLLVPASRAGELRDLLGGSDAIAVALVADDGLASLARGRDALLDDDRAALVHLEVALPSDLDPALSAEAYLDHLDFTAPAFLEVPRRGFASALDVIAADGAERAKYRTGGVEASAHPSEAELAAFLVGCARRRVPFKLTAGLHHALRTTTDEGFEQHGVLNVLAAVDAAAQGADEPAVAGLLALRDVGPVAAALAAGDPRRARGLWRSFGCCAPDEPMADIERLGLLAEG
jgi:hypothetical protein